MKKLMILAMSVMMMTSMSAQEANAQKGECKKDKKECKMSREQRIEMDIKVLSDELYLSEEQAAKFAVTYREYMEEKAKLKERFKAKFAKDLNERQVERVLHFKGPRPPQFDKGPCPVPCNKRPLERPHERPHAPKEK